MSACVYNTQLCQYGVILYISFIIVLFMIFAYFKYTLTLSVLRFLVPPFTCWCFCCRYRVVLGPFMLAVPQHNRTGPKQRPKAENSKNINKEKIKWLSFEIFSHTFIEHVHSVKAKQKNNPRHRSRRSGTGWLRSFARSRLWYVDETIDFQRLLD